MENRIIEFDIPFVHIRVGDWKNKKQRLLKLYESICEDMVETDAFTDYDIKVPGKLSYDDDVIDILYEEVLVANNTFGLCVPRIVSSWFQRYERGHFHSVHNHGSVGVSAVCYVEYDENEHEPLEILAPFCSLLGDTMHYKPNDVKEGSILFFPSHLLHYVCPSKSEKSRIILSFNILDFG